MFTIRQGINCDVVFLLHVHESEKITVGHKLLSLFEKHCFLLFLFYISKVDTICHQSKSYGTSATIS